MHVSDYYSSAVVTCFNISESEGARTVYLAEIKEYYKGSK